MNRWRRRFAVEGAASVAVMGPMEIRNGEERY